MSFLENVFLGFCRFALLSSGSFASLSSSRLQHNQNVDDERATINIVGVLIGSRVKQKQSGGAPPPSPLYSLVHTRAHLRHLCIKSKFSKANFYSQIVANTFVHREKNGRHSAHINEKLKLFVHNSYDAWRLSAAVYGRKARGGIDKRRRWRALIRVCIFARERDVARCTIVGNKQAAQCARDSERRAANRAFATTSGNNSGDGDDGGGGGKCAMMMSGAR